LNLTKLKFKETRYLKTYDKFASRFYKEKNPKFIIKLAVE